MNKYSPVIINTYRSIVRRLLASASIKSSSANSVVETPEHLIFSDTFETAADHFKEHRWAYIEFPIIESLRDQLVSNWPPDLYLSRFGGDMKIQNIGFKWGEFMSSEDIKISLSSLVKFPHLAKFLKALRSDEFCKRIEALVGVDEPMCCYYTSVRTGYEGGWLEFHKDGHGENADIADRNINISWHLAGIDGSDCGGLSLSKSPGRLISKDEFIHETIRLNNSCLIYGMDANFYHGYLPMRPGTFRYVITSQFIPRSKIKRQVNVK